jgi:hypothetical protein
MSQLLRVTSLCVLTLAIVGCAAKPVPVSGVVNFDGKPVEGATVTFLSADGKLSAAGLTDASGAFSLTTGNQPGAFPGEYKIVVVKSPKTDKGQPMDLDGSDYMKQMKKEAAEQVKSSKETMADMMKSKAMGKGTIVPPSERPVLKSELPAIYSSVTSTPLIAKVPPDTQPLQIDLKK